MFATGTIVNTVAIAVAGVLGAFAKGALTDKMQDALIKCCGVSVIFVSIAGVMEGMLTVQGGALATANSMLVVISMVAGTLIGELIGIEEAFEGFGVWLRHKSGNDSDKGFVEAFVVASLTVCVGAMAIVGAIEDGVSGDSSTLVIKSVLDFIIILVMTSSMGKGAAFSAVPIFLLEGSFTVLGRLIAPYLIDRAVFNLSLVGSILIFCVGVNLVWGKTVRVANMLPAIVIAAAIAYLPISIS